MKMYRSSWMGALSLLLVAPVWAQGTLFVEGDNVGIGTPTPGKPLHLVGTGIATMLQIDNTGPARITFNNTDATSQWSFGHENNDRFTVNRAGSGTQEFAVAPNGAILVSNSVVHSSSREDKESFAAVDPQTVLASLTQVPISRWSYKADEGTIRHIGPMAEDFYAAFGVGMDNRHIALNDSIGVALAAIQGLHRQIQRRDGQIEELVEQVTTRDNQIQELTHRLQTLEEMVSQIKNK